MNHLDGKKPQINYPCDWGYKVIGLDEGAVRGAVQDCLPDDGFSLVVSRASAGGKYVSLNLTLTVNNEEHRDTIFAALTGHPDVKMVI